jgi:hypothetical protein
MEKISPYDSNSVILEVIKMACDSIYNVEYGNDEINQWIELLVEQLLLFKNLKFVRVLCTAKRAEMLFKRLNWKVTLGELSQVTFNGSPIYVKWYYHPSPKNIIFNFENMREQRKPLNFPGRDRNPSVNDFEQFRRTAVDEIKRRKINVPLQKKLHDSKSQQKKLFDSKTNKNRDNPINRNQHELLSAGKQFANTIPKLIVSEQLVVQDPIHISVSSEIERFNQVKGVVKISEELSGRTSHNGQDCQFDSVLVQLPHLREDASTLRQNLANYIAEHRSEYIEDGELDQYLTALRSGAWGDEITLHALSQYLRRTIVVVTDRNVVREYEVEDSEGRIYLAYLNGNHYEPLETPVDYINTNYEQIGPESTSQEPLPIQDTPIMTNMLQVKVSHNMKPSHIARKLRPTVTHVQLNALGSAICSALELAHGLNGYEIIDIHSSMEPADKKHYSKVRIQITLQRKAFNK